MTISSKKTYANTRKAGILLLAALLMTVLSLCFTATAHAGLIKDKINDTVHRAMYAAQYADKVRLDEIKDVDDVALVAHRGYAAEAPENTIPAYIEAAKAGFKFVEGDILPTKDGQWVVSHDNSLRRMTGYNGRITDMTLEDIQSHPLTEGANIDKYPGLVTPTVEDWFKTLQEYDLYPVIEIKQDDKDAPYAELLDLLEKYNLKDKATFISFYKAPMEQIRALDPNVRMQWLVNDISDDDIAYAKKLGAEGIDASARAVARNPEAAKKVRDNGLDLNVWTVSTGKEAQDVKKAGANFLTVNGIYPDENENNFVRRLLENF